MKKILLLQGPNMNYLGKREPEIYGTVTAQQLDAMLLEHAEKHRYHLDIFYTNIEGEAVNRIYQAAEENVQGLVMNPAAFSYAGYAIKDCIKAVNLPYIEVHISNIAKRQTHSILAETASGVIYGLGIQGYFLALDAMLQLLEKTQRQSFKLAR